MKKMWQVAAHEFRRNAFRRSFLFSLFSVPFFIAFSIGLGFTLESIRKGSKPIGIVDHAGVLGGAVLPAGIPSRLEASYAEEVIFTDFPTEEAALTALKAGELQAYFIVPADYLQSRRVEFVFDKEPGENAWRQLHDRLQASLLSGQPPEITNRVVSGTGFIVRSIDGSREVPAASGPTFGLLMPLFIAMAFLFMLMLGSGYMMGAIAEEKENRTIEVLITSVSPGQLIGGKILGITAVSFTLLTFWAGVILSGLLIARQAGVGWVADLSMDWRAVLATVILAVPSYVLATALMTAIGAMVTTTHEGQSIGMIFLMLHMLPVYLVLLFFRDPQNPLAVLLSLLPFTSLMTIGLRNLFTIVPAWQVAAGAAVQMVCAAGAIWLAGRAFRLGLLRYGRRLSFRRLFSRAGGE